MRAFAICKRVLQELLRDKRTLALMFVAPVLILFLMKLIFAANSTTNVDIATVGVPSSVRTELNDVRHVAVHKKATNRSAQKMLTDQKADAVVQETSTNHYTITYANTDASKTAVVKQAFKAALAANGVKELKQTVKTLSGTVQKQAVVIAKMRAATAKASGQTATAAAPSSTSKQAPSKKSATVKIKNHYHYGDKDTSFFDKIVPILMGFFVFFFVFLISGMALLKERTTGTLSRLLATPVRRGEIVAGYMLSYGILALAQTAIIVLATVYMMGVEIVGSLLAIMVINFLLALVALAFGILMSTFASSEFQMMQFIPIVVIPQVFFSGIIPLDSLASWVQNIAYILPLKYAGDAMNQIIMYGTSLTHLGPQIGMLLVFLVVLTLLNVRGLRRYRKV